MWLSEHGFIYESEWRKEIQARYVAETISVGLQDVAEKLHLLLYQMVAEGVWVDVDAFSTLGTCCIEDVDWDNLLQCPNKDMVEAYDWSAIAVAAILKVSCFWEILDDSFIIWNWIELDCVTIIFTFALFLILNVNSILWSEFCYKFRYVIWFYIIDYTFSETKNKKLPRMKINHCE